MIRLTVDVFGDSIEVERDLGIVHVKEKYKVALDALDRAYTDAKDWLSKRIEKEGGNEA